MSILKVPPGPRDHALGPADAPVTLVEYGDYECPFCRRAHSIVNEVLGELWSEVRFVYRHFPLIEVHPNALGAAEAAEAAGAQGNFWAMHDTLYEHQDSLEPQDLVGYARALSLDVPRFVHALEVDAHIDEVMSDFRSGVRSGVGGTPTFFLDGVRFEGSWDRQSLTRALARAVEAVRPPRTG